LSTIGVFDSGIGGLSVLNEALIQSPGHHYIYLADSANAPYGEKSTQWVTDRSLLMCSWLASHGCDAIVVACNTATAQAISLIRQELTHVPIIGVEPGIKPASLKSKSKMIGVLATQNTLISDKFKQLLASLMSDCEFIQQAGNGLVPLIEKGVLEGPQIEALLHQYIDPMLALGVDTIVLGCTHYPFLHASIQKLYGDQLDIIDTSKAIVRQMQRLIKDPDSQDGGTVEVYSTQDGSTLLELAQKLLGHEALQRASAHTVSM